MIGNQVGHYKILRQIGIGGMGEVYAAEDLTLNREVALKLLPPDMAADPERRERFDREAKVIAALDHPNIVTIHSVEQAPGPDGDVHFITMQLVDGQTLSEIIPAGGFSVERFFELAIPLAEAMSVAHQQGITHRDLKPGNIMVAADGRLKVLDFGLAKLSEEPEMAKPDMATEAATSYQAPADLTEEGKVLGTVAYMSPEQAEGKAIDHRSDIFSLGIILYQMASGEAPFRGDTKLSIMSSIVKEAPTSITEVNSALPRHLGRIIRKCLEKDAARRYQSTLDLRNDLEDLHGEFASGEAPPISAVGSVAAPSRPPYGMIVAAVVVTAAAAVYAGSLLGGDRVPETAAPEGGWTSSRVTLMPGQETHPSLSPSGEQIVFAGDESGNFDIYQQRVGSSRHFNLTESSTNEVHPAYSPDGDSIAFSSDRDGGGIYRMGASGEDVRRVADHGFFPTWSPDGNFIAFGNATFGVPWSVDFAVRQILVVDADGGEPEVLVEEGLQPDWSPNGQRIAYFALREGGQRDIATVNADGTGEVPVTSDAALDWSPKWSPDGRHLYFSSDRGGMTNIWRVRIDEETGAVLGEPEQITLGGSEMQGPISLAAEGGSIAYAAVRYESNIVRVPFDAASQTVDGPPTPVTSGARAIDGFDVSPDGDWVVFQRNFPQEDLVLMRTDGTGESRLTNEPFKNRAPRFSLDGETVYFTSDEGGDYQVWAIRVDGSGSTQITKGDQVYPVFSPPLTTAPWMAFLTVADALLVDPSRLWDEQDLRALPKFEGTHRLQAHVWSPDGTKLAGTLVSANEVRDYATVFTPATETYDILENVDFFFSWLDDSRHVLFVSGERTLGILDTVSGDRSILAELPNSVCCPRVAPAGDYIYLLQFSMSSDIQLLEPRAPGGDSR